MQTDWNGGTDMDRGQHRLRLLNQDRRTRDRWTRRRRASGFDRDAGNEAAAALRRLADQYFDQVYFRYAPTSGTLLGLHQYDAQLEDYSRAAVDRETADLERFEGKFAAVRADQLDLTSQGDLLLLLADIHSTLLALNTIRCGRRIPTSIRAGSRMAPSC